MNSYQKSKLILLAVFVFGSLLIFWRFSENGRYKLSGGNYYVLDTRSGELRHTRSRVVEEPSKKDKSELEEVGFDIE